MCVTNIKRRHTIGIVESRISASREESRDNFSIAREGSFKR
jgi:hypothetical protein